MLATKTSGWHAGLDLRFSRRVSGAAGAGVQARTVLHHREHVGPLMVQKALYPEGPEVCHVALLHPPAGMVGGDSLRVDARLEQGARALLITPGATPWYRSTGPQASQHLQFSLAPGSSLEWLPRDNILFDGARVVTDDAIGEPACRARHGQVEYFFLAAGLDGYDAIPEKIRLRGCAKSGIIQCVGVRSDRIARRCEFEMRRSAVAGTAERSHLALRNTQRLHARSNLRKHFYRQRVDVGIRNSRGQSLSQQPP